MEDVLIGMLPCCGPRLVPIDFCVGLPAIHVDLANRLTLSLILCLWVLSLSAWRREHEQTSYFVRVTGGEKRSNLAAVGMSHKLEGGWQVQVGNNIVYLHNDPGFSFVCVHTYFLDVLFA